MRRSALRSLAFALPGQACQPPRPPWLQRCGARLTWPQQAITFPAFTGPAGITGSLAPSQTPAPLSRVTPSPPDYFYTVWLSGISPAPSAYLTARWANLAITGPCPVIERLAHPHSGQLALCRSPLHAAPGPHISTNSWLQSAYPLPDGWTLLLQSLPRNREAHLSAQWTARLVPLYTVCRLSHTLAATCLPLCIPLFARGPDLAPTGPCPCTREAGSSARWTARLVPLYTVCRWYRGLAHPCYNSSAYPLPDGLTPRLWSCAVIGGLPIRLVESSPRAAWHYKPSELRSPSSRPQWYLVSAASPRPTPQGYGHSSPWSAGLTLCHPQQCAISAQEPQSPPEAAMLPRRHWVCTYSASRASCPLTLLASTQNSAVPISIHMLHPHATGIYNSCHGTPAVLCPRDCDNLQVPLAAAGLYTFRTNSFSKTTSIHRGTFIWRLRLGS